MLTLLLSVVVGCRYTSDINQKLVPDKMAAQMLGMLRFPDQSQINEVLRRADESNVNKLQSIHDELFMQNARCLSSTEYVVVDIDQSGLIANGKTYELTDKGYLSKKKNQRGYHLSAAFCGGENSKTISVYLDPGNTHCSTRFKDLVIDTLVKLSDIAHEKWLILRLDSGYGSDRNIVVRTLTKEGDFEYTMLISNIPSFKKSAKELYHFYNKGRQLKLFSKP